MKKVNFDYKIKDKKLSSIIDAAMKANNPKLYFATSVDTLLKIDCVREASLIRYVSNLYNLREIEVIMSVKDRLDKSLH